MTQNIPQLPKRGRAQIYMLWAENGDLTLVYDPNKIRRGEHPGKEQPDIHPQSWPSGSDGWIGNVQRTDWNSPKSPTTSSRALVGCVERCCSQGVPHKSKALQPLLRTSVVPLVPAQRPLLLSLGSLIELYQGKGLEWVLALHIPEGSKALFLEDSEMGNYQGRWTVSHRVCSGQWNA